VTLSFYDIPTEPDSAALNQPAQLGASRRVTTPPSATKALAMIQNVLTRAIAGATQIDSKMNPTATME
jgi:hypothetical protein